MGYWDFIGMLQRPAEPSTHAYLLFSFQCLYLQRNYGCLESKYVHDYTFETKTADL